MPDANKPAIIRHSLLSLQVCVPSEWTDQQIVEWVEGENPAGRNLGWQIVRKGREELGGGLERHPCDDYAGNVHVLVEA